MSPVISKEQVMKFKASRAAMGFPEESIAKVEIEIPWSYVRPVLVAALGWAVVGIVTMVEDWRNNRVQSVK